MRLLGLLTLGFAGSFAVTVISIHWPETTPTLGNASPQALVGHTPVMHLAASSAATPTNEHP